MKMKTKSTLIALRMLPNQAKELDRFAALYGQKKSDLIREAIQVWLNTQWQKESKKGDTDAVAQDL